MSLALVVGVGVWGTKLILRDVSGVPVVQATEGPMRIAPDNPGGEAADHQGLSVNDVAGTGIAADPADRLTLAPRPVALSDEDTALGLTALASTAPARTDMVQTRLGAAERADTLSETWSDADQSEDAAQAQPEVGNDAIQALADTLSADVEPLSGAPVSDAFSQERMLEEEGSDTDVAEMESRSDEDAVNDAIAAALSEAIPRDIAGVAQSLRPQLRPTGLQETASLAPLVPAAPTTTELDPDTLPVGTRLVQLGAYDSAETARTEWTRLEARFGDYMEGKDRVIQRASSGGRVFYRLRAHGFDDIQDARRFCSAFVSENADCIPVVTR